MRGPHDAMVLPVMFLHHITLPPMAPDYYTTVTTVEGHLPYLMMGREQQEGQ